MENKETLKSRFLNEIRKPGFIKALSVFLFCVVFGLVSGFIFDSLQLSLTIGVGLGILWMGVAYFNQKED